MNPYESRTMAISPTEQMAMSRFVSATYGWMTFGLLVTAIIAYGISSSEEMIRTIVMNRAIMYGAILGELGLVLALSFMFQRISALAATFAFMLYAALNGVTMSTIFLAYTMTSVTHVFFITAGMFGGLALYGTVTRSDLTSIGAFVGMGLWGLILVGLANMFIQSESLSLGLSVAGVIVFVGLTAYDAQRIRALAYQSLSDGSGELARKGAIFGALMLYLDFINLFLSLLRLFGSRRD